MKFYFSEKEFLYDGSQLKHLFGYLEFKVLGDSIISWIGPCNLSLKFMADGEDLLAKSEIRGDKMLHFIIEKFEIDFYAGVALQRLISSMALDLLKELVNKSSLPKPSGIASLLVRQGDDIFYNDQKLSISIAKKMVNSVVIHFAVNVVNDGTPVKTLALNDLGVEPTIFAKKLMERISTESQSIIEATQKVL